MAIMTPRLVSPDFGLLDDGVTLDVAQRLVGERDPILLFGLELHRGRFRPGYWLYGATQYALWGPSPRGFFMANGVALLLTALAVAGAVAFATRDALASSLAGLAYLLSPPVIENYYTLSKPEVPLALWLAVSLCCWAGARTLWETAPRLSPCLLGVSAASLLFASLTKETAQAMLVVSLLWVIAAWGLPGVTRAPGPARVDRWYLAVNVGCTALFWITRSAVGTATIGAGDDSRHYALTGPVMAASALRHLAWYVRDFPHLGPLLAFVWWRERHRLRADPWVGLVPVFWIAVWTLIMLPWHSTLEYYLLPASIGVSVITGIGLASVLRSLGAAGRAVRIVAGTLLALIAMLVPAMLTNMVTNGRVQIAIDAVNRRLVDFLAATVPPDGTVLVNILGPNEYVVELGMHLGALKGRGDVNVQYLGGWDIGPDDTPIVATPVVRNQPAPSVRLAVSEGGAHRGQAELRARLGAQAELVYRETEGLRLLMAQLQAPLCALATRPRAHDQFLCASRRLLDRREFVYGWEVYRVNAP